MQIWGLHLVDLLMVAIYLAVMIWLGKRAAGESKSLDDFYLAGRKLGKAYQFFLNFGCSTHADQAVAVSREVYRQGIGGMWIQSLVLFLTPFYWFTVLLFRRVRLTTIGDFFAERFQSRFLAASYAIFTLVMSAFIGGGIGYLVAAKTMVAMTPKPLAQCTPAERTSIAEFNEFHELDRQAATGLTSEQRARYEVLGEKNKKGELRSFFSYVSEIWFYLIYVVVVGAYTMMGGFKAAALTDAIQGILIVIFSVMLVPVALSALGGFAGLHARVPAHMFELFGSATLSEYAWYTVLAMVTANLVSIIAVVSGMQTAGSAKNEFTARVGMIGGMFLKRILMLFWALAGLLAIGLYAGRLHDPDLIWGVMTRDLLWPGAIGLMLVGVLAASMSSLGASAVSHSALFIKNLYKPWVADRDDAHYLLVGRIVIGVTLVGGIAVALYADSLLGLFQYAISVPAVFGASIWLGFLWRRVTRTAAILQMTICLVIYAVLPNVFPLLPAVARNPSFLVETAPRQVIVNTVATSDDVGAGRASRPGEKIRRTQMMPAVAIYFDRIARVDATNRQSPRVGLGRFNAEVWALSFLGLDFSRWSKPQLVAARFFFDALFPFVLLVIFSYATRPVPKAILDDFYARLHTPVQASACEEQVALAAARADPGRFERDKLFPGTGWEIMKPAASDFVGFFGTCGLVALVVLLLWMMVTVQ
ncbi:MAG: sodium:solute symporter family protein [Bacteroidales bacterium]